MSRANRTWVEALLDHRFDMVLAAAAFSTYVWLCVQGFTVIPQFRSIFASMNVELPVTTQFLLAASDIASDWFLLVGPLVAAAGLWATVWVPLRWVQRINACPERSSRGLAQLGLSGYLILLNCAGMVAGLMLNGALYMPMLKLINNVG